MSAPGRPGHWRRVWADRDYRANWIYNLLVATSQWHHAVWHGGDPDQSLSGEIGRRLAAGERLGPVLALVKWAGDRLLGPGHWAASIEPDEGANSAALRRERV